MNSVTPFSVVVIKSMSIGREDHYHILGDLLRNCPVNLRMSRWWKICANTRAVLAKTSPHTVFLNDNRPSWILLFTHLDRVTDPYTFLSQYVGDDDRRKVLPGTLRNCYAGYQKQGEAAHMADDVVYLSKPDRADFDANLLFNRFDVKDI